MKEEKKDKQKKYKQTKNSRKKITKIDTESHDPYFVNCC